MIYRFLTILLWPVFFLYTLKIALRDKSSQYLFQRLGFSYPLQTSQTIWIHCASVGEVNTCLPLLQKLIARHSQAQFIITTNTVTGAHTVARHNLERTQHCFLPIESTFAIKRFINAWQPTQCIIMETEIWPLLYKFCYKNNISISIINARLSHRTLNTNSWFKSLYKTSLSYVDKILCKSEIELNNFKLLGADENKLIIAGNLKFTFTQTSTPIMPINLKQRKYCVAASTHNNEEQQLAELWRSLKTDMLLVIVPRHPNRSNAIQKQLSALNINFSVRSQQDEITEATSVYLADTLGELTQFIQGAESVFIGGSLIKHGGQNILEPCRLGKPTICGPYMFNFEEELQLLLNNNACIQVQNISELKTVFADYMASPENLNMIGDNAKQLLTKQSDILDKYISCLSSLAGNPESLNTTKSLDSR